MAFLNSHSAISGEHLPVTMERAVFMAGLQLHTEVSVRSHYTCEQFYRTTVT